MLTSIMETVLADVDDCGGGMLCTDVDAIDELRLDGGIMSDWVLKLVRSDALLPTFTRVLKFDATEL